MSRINRNRSVRNQPEIHSPPLQRVFFKIEIFDSSFIHVYSPFMTVFAGRTTCRHASRTAMSASVAETLRRVCPASWACHSASVGARSNMYRAGGLLVGPYCRNSAAASASMAPIRFSAYRSQRSRGACRSVHVAVFDAVKAGSVGTSNSAAGASA